IGGAIARRRRVREPLNPGGERCSGGFLLVRREAEVPVLDAPPGRPAIDSHAGLFGDLRPRIAIARVQPAAAEIEPISSNLDCPCASAEARARFQQKRRTSARRQRPRRADPRGTAANDDDVEVCVHPNLAWRAFIPRAWRGVNRCRFPPNPREFPAMAALADMLWRLLMSVAPLL